MSTNNNIEQLKTQIGEIRQRLTAAKGTPAEGTFKSVLAKLESDLEKVLAEEEAQKAAAKKPEKKELPPLEPPKGLNDEELVAKLDLAVKTPTLVNWRTGKTSPRGKNKELYEELLSGWEFKDELWFNKAELAQFEEDKRKAEEVAEAEAAAKEETPITEPEGPDDSDIDASLFQAVAWIKAEVKEHKDEEGKIQKKLIYKGKEFDVAYNKLVSGVRSLHTFSRYVANQGEMILAVYPRWTHFPGRDVEYGFRFEIFGWGQVPPDKELDKFYIKGIWQFIAVYQRPVITVYRNMKRSEDDKLKADHCPVFWKDAPVKPFRFNPKAEKDQQGDRYFVECICSFDTRFNSLVLRELEAEPTTEIPRYLKPVKAAPPVKGKGPGKGKGGKGKGKK